MVFGNFTTNVNDILIDILLQPGFFAPKMLWNSSIHEHSSYEFHYISDGKVNFYSNGENYSLSDENYYIVSPRTYHNAVTCSEKLCKISFLFSFKEIKNHDLYEALIREFESFSSFHASKKFLLLIEMLISYIVENEQSNINQCYIESIFTLIFFEMFESITSCKLLKTDNHEVNHSMFTRKTLVDSYIAENMLNPSLQGLSDALYLSRRQTSRFLKESMNETFSSLITKQRMEYAKFLIKSKKYSLDEISFMCGYNSYKGFYLAFLKYYGVSPNSYKE